MVVVSEWNLLRLRLRLHMKQEQLHLRVVLVFVLNSDGSEPVINMILVSILPIQGMPK